ncbi:MAG: bifunctional DNA-formamidopyrimidine glycosylase/DNA-(apurinic or apyrimidinic site) lyase [Deltaproteobacteria bacterium]|nr:bifunctional DNA-formamidopyrimidine glycosylase/DNA-(apurinic or apyrimidinic site) lyase [Deltaproteobacteria bacterium]
MPELPEVETVVRTLRPQLMGRTIRAIWASGLPLRMRRRVDSAALRDHCLGATVRAVYRRAKYILIDLERRGRSSGTLVVHLGMTGRLRVDRARAARDKHTHVAWTLLGGDELRFVDARRFGLVLAAGHERSLSEIRQLGPDAYDALVARELDLSLTKSAAPIKSFLLDQRRIAGLGNIYACEALFRAGIHPRMPACRARGRAALLAAAIRETLEIGISNAGTSFRDFVDVNGEAGTNLDALLVYGREGEPCASCGRPIRRIVQAGRSTFFCARCQKR